MWFIEKKKLFPILKIKNLTEAYNLPRQLLPKTYWQTAEIDITKTSTILLKKSMTGKKIFPLLSDEITYVDIDNLKDFEYAEKILKNNKKFIRPNIKYN